MPACMAWIDDPGPGVGGGFDHHAVELLLLDHLAEVLVDAPLGPAGEFLDVGLGPREHAVAGGHDLKRLHVGRLADQPRPAAAADHAHADRFARRAAPSSPSTCPGTSAGRAIAAAPALSISRRVK